MIAYLPNEKLETIIQNLESTETTHVNKLGLEYKPSSEKPNEHALMLSDQGEWCKSFYLNEELVNGDFMDVREYKKLNERKMGY